MQDNAMQKAVATRLLANEYTNLYLIAEAKRGADDRVLIQERFQRDFIDRGLEFVARLNTHFGTAVADRFRYIGDSEAEPITEGCERKIGYIIMLKEAVVSNGSADVPSGNGFLEILGLNEEEVAAMWSVRVAVGI